MKKMSIFRTNICVATVMFTVVMSLGGCATQQISDDTTFWQDFQINALEANPAKSLQDLTDRSSLIVAGKIIAVEQGPSSLPEEGPLVTTVALVLSVDDTIKGLLKNDQIKVIVAPASPQEISIAKKATPSGRYLLFLNPAQAGYYYCTTMAGLVGETPRGLETVVDPTQSNILKTSAKKEMDSLRDLEPMVKSISK